MADLYLGGPNFYSMEGLLNDNIYDNLDRKVIVVDSANTILDLVYFGGKFEYMLSQKFGIGLHYNYSINSVKGTIQNDMYSYGFGQELYPYKATFNSIRIIPMVNYHMNWDEDEDIYLGFGIGYARRDMIVTTSNPYYVKSAQNKHLPLAYRAEIGFRQYLNKHFGYLVAGGIGGGPIALVGLFTKF